MQAVIFRKPFLILVISFSTSFYVSAQQQDSTVQLITKPLSFPRSPGQKKYLSAKSMIIPVFFIDYGFSSLQVKQLQQFNKLVKEEVTEDAPGFKTKVDDYLKYAPMASVYVLNLAGVKGRHTLVDRTIIYAVSAFLSNEIVTKL